jgi:hypothetical protein
MAYELNAPPVVADLQAHAQAITAQAFKVSHRTLGDWPIEMLLVNGKRQPETAEVWAYALAVLGDGLSRVVLDRMSDTLQRDVAVRLPAARQIKAVRDATLKHGRGAHLRRKGVAA